ncbi:radical SAM family heme chaperone HemW [Cytophaga aurantiaca]|uniref:radical SAM family heme chaperone HemW n=1 Tax=Cytophaga aurantiaca TaxID=29530 RepID=UPI0003A93D94|nr:radical SAM family heme chaperone HemW [Cytophaga aurantiaca]
MSGIYIHIPYCHKACNYCNFHFSTSMKDINKMIDSICLELEKKKHYLNNPIVETVYFGGGTPSLLNTDQLSSIFQSIQAHYTLSKTAEITLEANPEDISSNSLASWKAFGINRLSIGVQSFQDHYLKWMNRNHTSAESLNSIVLAKEYGFDNISIDLIYGLPNLDATAWRKEINTAIGLNITHVSTYCLTIEEKTALGNLVEKGLIDLNNEETIEQHMLILMEAMKDAGYEQYEISNFCKPTFESKHNSSYWKRTPYIGIGPGAHSYNGETRQYNISSNPLYIKYLNTPSFGSVYTVESLSEDDQYNEYILTRLRTKWGIKQEEIALFKSVNLLKINQLLDSFCQNGFIVKENDIYKLTTKGKLLADEITLRLMV